MYGQTIKAIRLAKGMKQKEVYANVVSKSFYSDFEAEKNSIEIGKFLLILDNLGLSFHEFECYQNQEKEKLEAKIETLYTHGKFEELFSFYEENKTHPDSTIRYLAIKCYLFVLITNANFYKFSREPFEELVYELENYSCWHLKEISLAKLMLLSISESKKEEASTLFQRILDELEKYKELDEHLYYKEIADLCFNRIQSLLILNDINEAQKTCDQFKHIIDHSDHLYYLLQSQFIRYLLGLYLDFPTYQKKITHFLETIATEKSSEYHFYQIIVTIHQEKAQNYFSRYGQST